MNRNRDKFTWRTHEIMKRLQDAKQELEHEKLMGLLDRVEGALDAFGVPLRLPKTAPKTRGGTGG